jgi:hypothetical protein
MHEYHNNDLYDADLVWMAAFVAQRMNNGYVKFGEVTNKTANCVLLREIINNHLSLIRDQDRELAKEARDYYRGFTFKLLQGEISSFDRAALTVADHDQVNDRGINIIASLPLGFLRQKEKQRVESIIQKAQGGFVGSVGNRVVVNIEALRSVYSDKYGTNFITARTDQDQIVWFSFKTSLEVGAQVSVEGRVKRHDNNQTQLHYVQLKEKV